MKMFARKTCRRLILSAALCACCACTAGLCLTPAKASAENAQFTISQSPSVRLEGTGLRFSLSVYNEYAHQLVSQGEYAGYTATVGVVILPMEFLGTEELTATASYGEYTSIVAQLNNVDVAGSTDELTQYNVVVTDIPYAAYEQELTTRGFIKLTKTGAPDGYIYTEQTANASLADIATKAYLNEQNVEKKESLEGLLEEAIAGTTASFDLAEYQMTPPQVEQEFKLLGNKYGFEPSSAWIDENVVFATEDEGIAKVDGNTLLGQGEGETLLTAKIGNTVIASSTVTVGDFTVTDETGRFTWEYDTATSIGKGDKVYVNTGAINGTPNAPLTVNGYEVITNGKYAQMNGVVDLVKGLTLAEFMGNVVNTDGDPDGEEGATTTIIGETFKIRLTDAKDPTKTLDFDYITPTWVTTAFYFGFTYSNGTTTLNLGMENETVVYGYAFGNSSHALANIPKLIHHGEYQFGFGSGARDLFDKETGKKLATQLAEDGFGVEGVLLSFNSGSKGMMITQLADPIVEATPDETGKFNYQHNANTSVTKTTLNGVSGYQLTALGASTIVYNQPIELNNGTQDVFSFCTTTPSITATIIIRFTDYYDPNKGVAIALTNSASTAIGWGATGATYIRSGNVNDAFGDDFGHWTAIANDKTYLAGGTNSSTTLSYNASEGKFYVLLMDATPWYYGLKHQGDKNPFSAENVTCKVNVSIEFVSNGQPATLFVSNIGGAL